MRTAIAIFKSFSLDLLKNLSDSGISSGIHFIRCIRSDLQNKPQGFHVEMIKQQLRAMLVTETARARKNGYSHRISFSEFLRRLDFK